MLQGYGRVKTENKKVQILLQGYELVKNTFGIPVLQGYERVKTKVGFSVLQGYERVKKQI